jgi:hypothetical protein
VNITLRGRSNVESQQTLNIAALQHYSITVAAELSTSELLNKAGTLIPVQSHTNHKLNLVKCLNSSVDIIGAMKQRVGMQHA